MARKRDPDDDEDDYFDDDDIQEEESRSKKRKKRKFNLLDIEAEEDDMDDEDEEDEVEGLIADDDPDADDEQRAARAQRLQRKQQLESADPEEYLRYVEQRFQQPMDDDDDDPPPQDASGIDQQQFLPTIRDPRLYIVRVRKNGHERRAVLTLLQKHLDYKRKGIELGITSAVAPEHLKGIIYVEAATSTSVEQAIANLDIFNSYQGVKALRIEEMTDVLKVPKKNDKVKPYDWIRVKSGIYRGDLGQFIELNAAGNACEIRVIPRIDIKGERDFLGYQDDVSDDESNPNALLGGRKRGRPPQKLFDKEEMYRLTGAPVDIHAERSRETGDLFDVWNNKYFRFGLIHLKQPLRALLTGDDVQPQVEEIEKWVAAEQKLKLLHEQDPGSVTPLEAKLGLQLQLSTTVGTSTKSGLFKNDAVSVVKGEQKGLDGVIVEIDGTTVLIQSPDFPVPLRVNRADVVKTFKAGETVKVASGKYAGESGAIVSVDGEFLTIFTDSTRKEIRVLTSHVADSQDLNPGTSHSASHANKVHFATFDLVSLTQDNTRAVVVKVMDDSVTIIDTNNSVSNVPFSAIKAKLRDQSARSHDARGNPIATNDTIHVISGPSKHRHGVVLHVCGPNIFFRAHDEINNACGVIACLANSVNASTAAARRLKTSLGGGRSAPAPIPRGSISSLGSGGVTDPRRPRMGGPGGMNKDPLMRQEVKVIKGEWKGYKGIVVYADSKILQIQLAANMKTVKVAKNKVKMVGAPPGITNGLSTIGTSQNGGGLMASRSNGFGGPRRPPVAPQTPRDRNYMQTPNPGSMSRRMATPAPDRGGFGFTPGPHQTPRSGFGVTPRSDAFRPTTPRANVDPYATNPYDYSRGASTPVPMTPASDNAYAPFRNVPQTPNTPGDTMGVGTPGPYSGGIVEPRTPANNLVPSTPAPFASGGIIEPRTPANMDPHTPGPIGAEPQTPAPGLEPATPAPGLEPATPAPGLEPATPMVEPTTPHTPGAIPQTPMEEQQQDGGQLGYKVLVDVVVSIASEDSYSGVVRDAAIDGSQVTVLMLAGPRNGSQVNLKGIDITPVQPRSEIDENNLEMVKVLDGAHQGKIGELIEVRGDPNEPDGVVRFNSGEVGVLTLSFVAKCHRDE